MRNVFLPTHSMKLIKNVAENTRKPSFIKILLLVKSRRCLSLHPSMRVKLDKKELRNFPYYVLKQSLVRNGEGDRSYSISMIEYRYLVATTKRYEDYLETMLYIKLLRDEPSVSPQFEAMRGKFDNRMNKAIESRLLGM